MTAGVDPRALLRVLGISAAASVRPVSGGSATEIWRVETGSSVYALRVFPPDQAEVCDREAVVMGAAATGGIPVPEIHARGSWHERSALLLAWCPGRPILYQVLRQPWRAPAYGRVFGAVQAEIHSLRAPEDLMRGGRSWVDGVYAREEALRQRLQALDVRRDALIHMDYHPLNVMVDRGKITGVLDWTNSGAGDPRADVARTKTILRLDMGRPYLPRAVSFGLGTIWAAFEWGWWQGYRAVAHPGENMELFYAAAGSYMERDLAHRYTLEQLAHVSRWTERWKRRAGLSDSAPHLEQ